MAANTLTANARASGTVASGDTLDVTLRNHGAEGVRIKCDAGSATGLLLSRIAKRAGVHLLSSDADEKYPLAAGESIDIWGALDDMLVSFRLAPATAADATYSFLVLKT